MADPTILPYDGTPLDLQVATQLAQDATLIAALGQRLGDNGVASGANSVYPNYTTDGPSDDRRTCPTPFLVVLPGGTRAIDRVQREVRVAIEVHDDHGAGRQRWPGILRQVKTLLLRSGWRPLSDSDTSYQSGLYFDDESPPGLEDNDWHTIMVQLVCACRASDMTSGAGING